MRKLPPELIAAFRATLEEVTEADLLLLVLDSSDIEPVDNYNIVIDTLKELDADQLPRITVLNKTDRAGESIEFTAMELRAKGEKTVNTCALTGDGFSELLGEIKYQLALKNFNMQNLDNYTLYEGISEL